MTYSRNAPWKRSLHRPVRDNVDVRRATQFRGSIERAIALSNGSETLRFARRGMTVPTAFIATKVLRIGKRSFPKEAKLPGVSGPNLAL